MKGDIPLFDLSALTAANEAEALGINVGNSFANPLAGTGLVGPGSHQEDMVLNYMEMPKEMDTFDIPVLPEVEDLAEHPQAGQVLQQLQQALDQFAAGADISASQLISLDGVSAEACALLYQTLGEGEVALVVLETAQQPARLRVQETVLAGVWWVQQVAADQLVHQWLEVGAIPAAVLSDAFPAIQASSFELGELPAGLLNGASVMVELLDKAAAHTEQAFEQPHVVNLSLLPFSAEDQLYLNQRLGNGRVVVLSRGYGNCRINSTAVNGIWRVQYFNSTDQLILDTLEVVRVPQVACAAREDLEDSAERLREIYDALLPA
ncbi:hydrogenase expression/formation protein [Oceanobacter mangrovi]|uniref:hydrogenase expression/formation protein n=1 Tax=Oceanobacter mangrovi TaxID=2862510 RepID=UPI001C8D5C68|nr:hydrogenase expression/formation protein [Oceanobacter mangrovi]